MNIETICIDLGASYTKIGYRPVCNPPIGRPFDHEAEVFKLDGEALIPSLAIQTRDKRKPWLFGQEASNSRIAPQMVVHTNWKAGLYGRRNNAEAARSAIVAKAFFEWLGSQIERFVPDMGKIRVRVTLPAFDDVNDLKGVVLQCLRLAGWRPLEIEFTTEPHANAIGLMTLGRNYVTSGKKGQFLDFGKMFGMANPYVKRAREVALADSEKNLLRMTIIDIGAFTTDLARLEFNVATLETEADGLTGAEQESFTVGMHDQLDAQFWSELERLHGSFVNQLTYSECEELKRRLFAGISFAITIDGQRKVFGNEDDFAASVRCADGLVEDIWKKIEAPFLSSEAGVVYMTGGGSQIAPVVAAMARKLRRIEDQPKISARSLTTVKNGLVNWRTSGVDVGRLATAIGGVSVLPPTELGRGKIGIGGGRPITEPSGPGAGSKLRQCTCHGNPDCPRCGGTGYISVAQ